jgi:hypothetical protein
MYSPDSRHTEGLLGAYLPMLQLKYLISLSHGGMNFYGARACHLCTLVSQSRGDHVCLLLLWESCLFLHKLSFD